MRYLILLLAILCASCGTALPTVKPYKLDVQQGNVVTSKMLLQLRPGMTKSQVRFILGTPLIQDSFHGNRWDYVYQLREAGKLKEQRRVILDFENDLLKSVRGDVIPAGSDAANAKEEAPKGTRVVTPVKKPQEKGMLDKLKFWEKDETAQAKEAAEKEAAAKARQEAEAAKGGSQEAIKADDKASQPGLSEEEPKSLLAVPIEAPAATDQPAAAPAVTVPAEAGLTPEATLPAGQSSDAALPKASPPPANDALGTDAAIAQPEAQGAALQAPHAEKNIAAPSAQPSAARSYDSLSGMQFDRSLKSLPEEGADSTEVVQQRPGGKNKVPPTPQPLPQEEEISVFDRILEQIGF